MERSLNPLHSVPVAILLGCLLISLSVLISGGVIHLKGSTTSPTAQITTQANTSLPDKLIALAGTLGLDKNKFKACVDANKYNSLITKDIADASAAGGTGTPTFIIGKEDGSGNLNGTLIVGAYPYSRFKDVIDAYLNGTTVPKDTTSNQDNQTAKAATSGAPVLGQANAPITILEFSDYECPFCKRHFQQTAPQIQTDYINTGKVKLVYRNFIAVDAHNPAATIEANAAECSREQGGDATYFKYHDALYTKSQSNGKGIS